ncbi:hypothetical protein [Rathayibacter sp. VKM Ac-2630]|uniref:hypothetical protein n=1 Tax=Rathayibacter sp. VKM Ac-2630 TaxID=1938617 RepID=UPI00098259F2|nr:hypothetical protein [Rathayibacter sp. VKM Ac-2630]OOB90285.1 hypothetical protein B0T42_12345 [Rathayibacter sp. VKM Ac-2630]
MADWTYTLHEARTGNLLGAIDGVSSFSFDRVANDVSTGSASIVLEPGNLWGPLLTRTHGSILVKARGGRVHAAGYIENDDGWRRKSRTLTVSLVDVRDQLTARLMYAADAVSYRAGEVAFTGKNYSGAVRAILIPSASGRGEGWNLPLVFPPDGSGDLERVYRYWDMVSPDRALAELSDLADGPDLDFEPRYRDDGGIEWVVRVGGPQLSGPDFDINLDAPENAAMDWAWKANGQDQRSGSIAVGNGSEVDMLVAFANNLPGPSMVIRDMVESYKEITDAGTLLGHAYSDLWSHRAPTEQWSLDLDADYPIAPGETLLDRLRVGARVSLGLTGDPVIPDGWHDLYCIGYSTDTTTKVTLHLQPLREPV